MEKGTKLSYELVSTIYTCGNFCQGFVSLISYFSLTITSSAIFSFDITHG